MHASAAADGNILDTLLGGMLSAIDRSIITSCSTWKCNGRPFAVVRPMRSCGQLWRKYSKEFRFKCPMEMDKDSSSVFCVPRNARPSNESLESTFCIPDLDRYVIFLRISHSFASFRILLIQNHCKVQRNSLISSSHLKINTLESYNQKQLEI